MYKNTEINNFTFLLSIKKRINIDLVLTYSA